MEGEFDAEGFLGGDGFLCEGDGFFGEEFRVVFGLFAGVRSVFPDLFGVVERALMMVVAEVIVEAVVEGWCSSTTEPSKPVSVISRSMAARWGAGNLTNSPCFRLCLLRTAVRRACFRVPT